MVQGPADSIVKDVSNLTGVLIFSIVVAEAVNKWVVANPLRKSRGFAVATGWDVRWNKRCNLR